MAERLVANKLPVYAVLQDPSITKPATCRQLQISEQHWTTLEMLPSILKPLQIATQHMGGEEFATLGHVYPILHGLINIHMKVKDDDSPQIIRFKETVQKELKRRFFLGSEDTSEVAELCIIASALHPSYKSLRFLTEDKKKWIHDKMKLMIQKVNEANRVEPAENSNETNNDQNSTCGAMKYLLGYLFETPNKELSISEELDTYFLEPPSDMDVLQWWKLHGHRFPRILKLARRICAIPATSIPSERLFSAAGLTVTKNRAYLDGSTVDQLLFMNSFLKMQNKQETK
jgi:hypothetical protein